jgi:hypothetical protein
LLARLVVSEKLKDYPSALDDGLRIAKLCPINTDDVYFDPGSCETRRTPPLGRIFHPG